MIEADVINRWRDSDMIELIRNKGNWSAIRNSWKGFINIRNWCRNIIMSIYKK